MFNSCTNNAYNFLMFQFDKFSEICTHRNINSKKKKKKNRIQRNGVHRIPTLIVLSIEYYTIMRDLLFCKFPNTYYNIIDHEAFILFGAPYTVKILRLTFLPTLNYINFFF